MDWSAISMVEIDFFAKIPTEEQLQKVEEVLRKEKNVDNLTFHYKKITFFIWGKDKVDYNILDELKDKLKGLGFDDFDISAEEFTKSGNDYRYKSI